MTSKTFLRLTAAGSVIALGAACQTIAPVSDQPRLALLEASPVDYSRFPERRAEDAEKGRGLMGDSFELADTVKDSNLVDDQKMSEDLESRLGELLPKNYSYKVGDKVLAEYPLETRAFIYDLQRFDAHALPTGDLLFTNELLSDVHEQDTIDWIIAHEAGHQLLDHHKSRENRAARNQVISILGTVAIIASGQRGNAGNLALGATYGALLLNNAGVNQFEVKEEMQADQLAMDLLLQKDAPRNPTAGIDQLKRYVANQEAAIAGLQKEADELVAQYVNYCGESGLFASIGNQNPNAQTRACQQWYVVGKSGVEQYKKLPEAMKTLEKLSNRVTASGDYFRTFIETREDPLPPTVNFEGRPIAADMRRDYTTSYAYAIDKNGKTVRTYLARRVDDLLKDGKCAEAVATARDLLSSPDDADPQMRWANYRAERSCPAEAKTVRKNRTKAQCKPSAGHFGAHEHLCVSWRAKNHNDKILGELQQEFENRGYYDDAYKVLVDRRANNTDKDSWLPQIIELLRKAGRMAEAEEEYQTCASLDVDKDFKDRCERAAYPERFTAPAGDAATPSPSGTASPPPLNLIGYDPSTTYDVFERALVGTELKDLLGGAGEYVIYMPSDGAIRRYLGGDDPLALLEPQNRPKLKALVAAHIVRSAPEDGKRWSSPHLAGGFSAEENVEDALRDAGGLILEEHALGAVTLKPVDTVIIPANGFVE